MSNWDTGMTYRMAGGYYPQNRLVKFDTSMAKIIQDEEYETDLSNI